jgi:hypothetical protein
MPYFDQICDANRITAGDALERGNLRGTEREREGCGMYLSTINKGLLPRRQ